MKKLTFKEYYESKEALLQASLNLPKIVTEYIVKKYCKLPVILEADKDYIPLKPKDAVKILWEFHGDDTVHVKSIMIEGIAYSPVWSDEKIKKWVESTTMEKAV